MECLDLEGGHVLQSQRSPTEPVSEDNRACE